MGDVSWALETCASVICSAPKSLVTPTSKRPQGDVCWKWQAPPLRNEGASDGGKTSSMSSRSWARGVTDPSIRRPPAKI